jgi:hypothetical protein
LQLYIRFLSNIILNHYFPCIFGLLVRVFLVKFVTWNGSLIWTISVEAEADQEIEPISNQISQAGDDIENDLKKQGEIIWNKIKEQFGFENVQSNLTQAYEFSFAGDLKSANTILESAKSALEDSINSMLRSGQQLISIF